MLHISMLHIICVRILYNIYIILVKKSVETAELTDSGKVFNNNKKDEIINVFS